MPAPQITTSAVVSLMAGKLYTLRRGKKNWADTVSPATLIRRCDEPATPPKWPRILACRFGHVSCSTAGHACQQTARPTPPPPLGRLLACRRGGGEAPIPAPDGGHLGAGRQGEATRAAGHRNPGSAPLPSARRRPVQ